MEACCKAKKPFGRTDQISTSTWVSLRVDAPSVATTALKFFKHVEMLKQ